MICYNVFLELDPSLNEAEWIDYMIQEHIPEVMKSGCFNSSQMMKVTDSDRQWHIQYVLDGMDNMQTYQHSFADQLKKEVVERYPNKFTASRTITQIIHSF